MHIITCIITHTHTYIYIYIYIMEQNLTVIRKIEKQSNPK